MMEIRCTEKTVQDDGTKEVDVEICEFILPIEDTRGFTAGKLLYT